MSDIVIMPDNPMSVMTLFDSDKASLDRFIDYIANTIESGMDDPLKVLAISKKMEYVTDGVKARIKDATIREAEKHGEKSFPWGNCEMHLAPTYTKYDYSKCNDPEWEESDAKERSGSNSKKEREKFLQQIKKSFTMIDDRTGEVITITPPVKTQTMGVKVTIK